jgi:phosphoribosylanthranilate isomerase
MFRIKICGVNDKSDIDAVAEAGADAVGLNFHPTSIRFVNPVLAKSLSEHASKLGLARVGVFVDQDKEAIASIAAAAGLDCVQLHGSQSAIDARWLTDRGLKVIGVSRLPPGPLEEQTISASIDRWKACPVPLLFDADAGVHGGGLGLRLDWSAIGSWAKCHGFSEKVSPATGPAPIRWGLAGGLTPETVGEAIAKSGTASIDVASGVEEPRGKKNRRKIEDFVSAAQAAWRPLQSGEQAREDGTPSD